MVEETKEELYSDKEQRGGIAEKCRRLRDTRSEALYARRARHLVPILSRYQTLIRHFIKSLSSQLSASFPSCCHQKSFFSSYFFPTFVLLYAKQRQQHHMPPETPISVTYVYPPFIHFLSSQLSSAASGRHACQTTSRTGTARLSPRRARLEHQSEVHWQSRVQTAYRLSCRLPCRLPYARAGIALF